MVGRKVFSMKHNQSLIALFLTVLLVATAGCTDNDDEKNEPPEADAGQDQTKTMVEDQAIVTFKGSGSSDPNGDTLSYSWDFDASNGANDLDSDDMNPTHTYIWTGTYTVTLTVSDGKLTDIDTMTVTIKKEPGNVEAVISSDDELMDTVGEGEVKTITFDGSSSSTKEGSIEEWEWDFNYTGSNEFDVDATGEEVSFDFGTGIHRVGLRVTNDTGAKATDDVNVMMNYNQTYNEIIDSDETQSFPLPLVSERAFYLRVVLVYNNSEYNALDLDIYLFYPNGTESNNTSDVDDDHEEIRYDRGAKYGNRLKALGDWEIEIRNGQYSRSSDYYLYIDVVYFS